MLKVMLKGDVYPLDCGFCLTVMANQLSESLSNDKVSSMENGHTCVMLALPPYNISKGAGKGGVQEFRVKYNPVLWSIVTQCSESTAVCNVCIAERVDLSPAFSDLRPDKGGAV